VTITVQVPGLHSTLQDVGRPGYYAMGVPPSGALDMYAHEAANALCGNASHAASIEVTFLGPTLVFSVPTVIAVTGADIDVTLNGMPVPGWTSQFVRAGQTLTFGALRGGARAYLAVRGGFAAPLVMGSRSTYALSGLGGLNGGPLRAGDVLHIGNDVLPGSDRRPGEVVPESLRPRSSGEQEIRVVPGLCDYRLTAEAKDVLYSTPYEVATEANRTGYRFHGASLSFVRRVAPFGAGDDPSNVVNLGYPIGSIQAPSGSELICLLRDAVTGGGYATVGTVISADLDLIAQLKAPDRVMFRSVNVDEALGARRDRRLRLERIATLVQR
jgi:biotin-dependent carboxylase-like uncharacterized protein